MSVIGKRAEDKETKELSVGRLTQVKTNPIGEDGTDFIVKPDDLNLLLYAPQISPVEQQIKDMKKIEWEIYELTLFECKVKSGVQRWWCH